MDFFELQDQARRKTRQLVALFCLAILGTILALHGVVLVVLSFDVSRAPPDFRDLKWQDLRPEVLGWVALATLLIIGGGCLRRILQFRWGGESVAAALGGRRIHADSAEGREKVLVNVVEEMAIASGLPVPACFVLDEQAGLNAFAAGHTPEDAAVAVTSGLLRELPRSELQAVVAHEFAHIRHGDMRLNLRLVGLLHGLLLISLIGRSLMTVRSARSFNRDRDKGRAMALLIGLLIWIIGGIGFLFGRVIQSAVSREREFMADAAAVELTRDSGALARALTRVARASQGARVDHPDASEFSHFFFAGGVSGLFSRVFASHPPIEERIRRLLPSGEPPPDLPADDQSLAPETEVSGFAPASPARSAARVIDSIPPDLRGGFARTDSAGKALLDLIRSVSDASLSLPLDSAIAAVEAGMPALRALPEPETRRLLAEAAALVSRDGQISLAEFCLLATARHAMAGGARSEALEPEPEDVRTWLALVVASGPGDAANRSQAWTQAHRLLGLAAGPWDEIHIQDVDTTLSAVARLASAPPLRRRALLGATRIAMNADGVQSDDESALLRTLAISLRIPWILS